MKLTLINKENEEYFLTLMTEAGRNAQDNAIRIGVLNDAGHAAGALVARIESDVLDIISLFVSENSRRNGYATAMIKTLIGLCDPGEQTAISVQFCADDELYGFFEALGFELIYDMPLEFVTLRYAHRSRICKKNVLHASSNELLKISDLNRLQSNTLANYFRKNGLPVAGDHDADLSTLCMKDEEVKSIMLAKRVGSDVTVLWMDFKPSRQKDLFKHLGLLIRTMDSDEHFDDNSRIYFAPENGRFTDTLVRLSIGAGYVEKDTDYFYGVKMLQ